MNDRERMLGTIRGEPCDALPWAPRMDAWAVGQLARGTLPERFRGKNTAEIADELGVACHAVRQDESTTLFERVRATSRFARSGSETIPTTPTAWRSKT